MRVLVTGATSGIGAATAEAFVNAGHEVVATGRRKKRLRALTGEWSRSGAEAIPLPLDVRDAKALAKLQKKRGDLLDVDVLVNNAGLARGLEPLQAGDPEDWQVMLDTNVMGLLRMTRAVVPGMLERGSGHIVNVGSIAGRWVYPGGGVYCATKHAVGALTEGLRFDLHGTGLRVSNIEPGLVETEFSIVRFGGDEERAAKVYADTTPLRPEDVADAILWTATRPGHVNVQEMVLYPTDQASVRDVHRG